MRSLGILAEAILSFQAIPRGLDSECSAAAALKLFLEEAAGARIPERPDAAAVEVLGWLELHLDDAPAVILASVNDPWLPESVSADPFLPDALRRVLGLADPIAIYKLELGTYPESLSALLEPTPSFPNGFIGQATLPNDAWGRPFTYERSEDGTAYRMWSVGPNGVDEHGHGDDVDGL